MERLRRKFLRWLWRSESRSRPELFAVVSTRFAVALGRDLKNGELSLRAMSLVYTTMLAIVPLLFFSFSVLKGLGFHRQLEPMLLNFLAPLGPRGEELNDTIMSFVDNVSGTALASVSLALLLYTALSMAQKVEESLNFVWQVDRSRSLARRFSEYLTVMLVGPLLMSVAMGITAAVSSTAVMAGLRATEPFGSVLATLSTVTPYALVVLAFAFLYKIVPNTHVRLAAALAGGLLAGILWAGGGRLFAQFVVTATRTEAIYSGFAIVIVAMLWLYLSWLILLIGAQLAFYVQNPDYLRLGRRSPRTSNTLRERLALNIMLLIGRDFDEAGPGWRGDRLSSRLGVPRHVLEPVIAALMSTGLLTTTREGRLLPARDLRRISLLDVLAAVRSTATDNAVYRGRRWNTAVMELSDRLDDAIASELGNATLADLVERDEREAEPGAGVRKTSRPDARNLSSGG
jgi:membrane protein